MENNYEKNLTKTFHFDADVAIKYGVNEAIMLQNIIFWIHRNKCNESNNYDGRTWTRNTRKAFIKQFPFWSEQTIRTTLKHLIDNNVILTANYNKTGYDKTLWYGLVDEIKYGISPLVKTNQWSGYNQPMEVLKSTNRSVETNQPIPYTKTDTKYISTIKVEPIEKKEIKVSKYFLKKNDKMLEMVALSQIEDIKRIIQYNVDANLYSTHISDWSQWVAKMQSDIGIKKHYTAWVKSFVRFVEKNELRRKKAPEAIKKPFVNPYSFMSI